jgi:hypothetical protein
MQCIDVEEGAERNIRVPQRFTIAIPLDKYHKIQVEGSGMSYPLSLI